MLTQATPSGHVDPAGNMFEVAVDIILDEAYFIRGWNAVGRFYGLLLGGWVRLVFARTDLFLIQLRDRLNLEVFYPLPPKVTCIGDSPTIINVCAVVGNEVANHYANLWKKPHIFHVLEKNLTHTDVNSDFLHIPVDFCQVAFRHSGVTIVLVDDFGLTTTTYVEFQSQNPNISGLIHGWHRFSMAKGFFEGLRVQFAVPCTNPNIMVVAVSRAWR